MPNVQVTIYLSVKEWDVYSDNPSEFNSIARAAFKKALAKVK